jgi:hypothetical protein
MTAQSESAHASERALSPDEFQLLAWVAEYEQADPEGAEVRANVQRLLAAGCDPALALQLGVRAGLVEP